LSWLSFGESSPGGELPDGLSVAMVGDLVMCKHTIYVD
jgi:hypothetical protein